MFRCPQETDVALLHKQEMEKAAKEAKAKYLQEHPEVTEASLKFDPVKNLESGEKKLGLYSLIIKLIFIQLYTLTLTLTFEVQFR